MIVKKIPANYFQSHLKGLLALTVLENGQAICSKLVKCYRVHVRVCVRVRRCGVRTYLCTAIILTRGLQIFR